MGGCGWGVGNVVVGESRKGDGSWVVGGVRGGGAKSIVGHR